MPTDQSDALVLRSFNVGDQDKIIVFFSREKGLIKGVAKGVGAIGKGVGEAIKGDGDQKKEDDQKKEPGKPDEKPVPAPAPEKKAEAKP